MQSKALHEKLYLFDDMEKRHFEKKDIRIIRDMFSLTQKELHGKKEYCFRQASDDLIEITKQPRQTYIPPHFHTYIELNYVYSGRLVNHIRGEEIIVNPGEILLLDQNVLHEIDTLSENDIAIAVIINKKYLTSDLVGSLRKDSPLEEFFLRSRSGHSRMENHILFHAGEEQEQIRNLIDMMLCEFYDMRSNSENVIQSLAGVLLQYLSRITDISTNMEFTRAAGKGMLEYDEVMEFIGENYQTCDLTMLENHFGFNPHYISTYLKKRTGMSFKEILLREKMKHAKLLMDDTSLLVIRIIEIVGFSNPTFFYKKFEEFYHIPLSQYQRKK